MSQEPRPILATTNSAQSPSNANPLLVINTDKSGPEPKLSQGPALTSSSRVPSATNTIYSERPVSDHKQLKPNQRFPEVSRSSSLHRSSTLPASHYRMDGGATLAYPINSRGLFGAGTPDLISQASLYSGTPTDDAMFSINPKYVQQMQLEESAAMSGASSNASPVAWPSSSMVPQSPGGYTTSGLPVQHQGHYFNHPSGHGVVMSPTGTYSVASSQGLESPIVSSNSSAIHPSYHAPHYHTNLHTASANQVYSSNEDYEFYRRNDTSSAASTTGGSGATSSNVTPGYDQRDASVHFQPSQYAQHQQQQHQQQQAYHREEYNSRHYDDARVYTDDLDTSTARAGIHGALKSDMSSPHSHHSNSPLDGVALPSTGYYQPGYPRADEFTPKSDSSIGPLRGHSRGHSYGTSIPTTSNSLGNQTMEKKYQCHVCGKFFRRDLPRHLRTHEEVARFVCPYPRAHCPHKRGQFNRPYDYKKHLLHSHFIFDDQKTVRSFRDLRSKLGHWGTCVCGVRSRAGDWLANHVLGGDNPCPYLTGHPTGLSADISTTSTTL